MSPSRESLAKIRSVAKADGRFHVDAYLFTIEALNLVLDRRRREGLRGHVDGQEVLKGVRMLGQERFGWLGATVLQAWGLSSPREFGDIVFQLVDAGILSKQDEDSPEDFAASWSFEEVFEREFLPPSSS